MSDLQTNTFKRRNRVLFDFESLVDPVLSYYKYLVTTDEKFKYSMEELEFMRLYDDSILMKNYDKDGKIIPHFTSMIDLYKEFINLGAGLIKPSVLCKNEKESQIIKNEIPTARILVGERNKIDINNFSRLVIGNLADLIQFKIPNRMDIMLLDFKCNYDEDGDIPNKAIVFVYGDKNSFSIARAYSNIQNPEG